MTVVSWLFGPKDRIPDGEIVYAVGDIHGRDDLLGLLHEAIEEDLAGRQGALRATVVYLGDYVDRGPGSKAVIDRLIDRPVRAAESVFLKGNHEDAMLRFLQGHDSGKAWFTLGGGATARSYGVSLRAANGQPLPPEASRTSLNSAIPEHHLAFLRGLQLSHEIGDYFFVHAGVKPGLALDDQATHDLLWIRDEFLRSRERHSRRIVHGHSSGNAVVVRRNRICVDTAAYATDRLSCLVLTGSKHRIICAEV